MARTGAFAQQIAVMKADLHKSVAQTMASAARQAFASAQATNRAELGRDIAPEVFVDGRKGAPLESVKPGGKIVGLFPVGAVLLEQAVDFAISEFMRIAPVGRKNDPHSGLYRASLRLLVNGVQHDASREGVVRLKETDTVSLTNLVPYSRKLEIGRTESGQPFSVQVPNGVFQAMRQTVNRRYGGLVRVGFTFEHYGAGFAVGRGRTGTKGEQRRAASYPTLHLSLK